MERYEQQERERQVQLSSLRPGRKTFWLTILGFGVLLVPIEYILGTNSGGNSLLPFPWFVSTLSSCFVAGVLCTLITTRRLESRSVFDFLLRGGLSGLCTSLFNVFLWLAIILTSGIYNIYHPAPVPGLRAPALHPSWGLLVLVLLFFLVAACFHVLAASFGGLLSGLFRGYVAKLSATHRART
jgi:hypothetical protein